MRKYEVEKNMTKLKEKKIRENAKGNENMVTFARNLRKCLQDNNLNESEFLRKIENSKIKNLAKISKPSLNAYVNGENIPSIDKLITISKVLGVSTDYLLGLSEIPSFNEDFKLVHKHTGLSEKAIKILKSQLEYHEEAINCNSNSTEFLDGIKTISYLIENEEKYNLFKNLANFLWFDIKNKNLVEKKTPVINDDYEYTYTIDMLTSLTKLNIDKTLYKLKDDIENQNK